MRVLITAGPTWEAIDPVRYIGNRSSGKMGRALARAGAKGGHQVTVIVGPGVGAMPAEVQRLDVESSDQMLQAVRKQWPEHDLLIMAAAVADYRPREVAREKLGRGGKLVIELEATEDIVAAAARDKRADQRVVAFSLENQGHLERARQKMKRKGVDLMVYNPAETMGSETIEAVLLYPDGREEAAGCRSKGELADMLLQRAVALFG
jgi:phosphopantothenoylcysteine decarboxylase/phosphopantothenate--cysteine ligase